jgi:hypothetical protein
MPDRAESSLLQPMLVDATSTGYLPVRGIASYITFAAGTPQKILIASTLRG